MLVGARAENIEVSTTQQPGWQTAEVAVAEPSGSAVLLTVRWGPHEVKVHAGPGFTAGPGDRVWLRAPR